MERTISKLLLLILIAFVYYAVTGYYHEQTHQLIASYFGVKTEMKYRIFYGSVIPKNIPEDPQAYAMMNLAQSFVEVVFYFVASVSLLVFIVLIWVEIKDD